MPHRLAALQLDMFDESSPITFGNWALLTIPQTLEPAAQCSGTVLAERTAEFEFDSSRDQ
jgi:hypothetical protein